MMSEHYTFALMSQHRSSQLPVLFPHLLRIVAGTSLLSALPALVLPTASALDSKQIPTIIAPSNLTKISPTATKIARLDLNSPLPATYKRNSRPLLQISTLKTYQHPSKLFSIDVPQKWQLENFSEPNHVRVQWQDANHHGLICVELFNFSGRVTKAELGDQLSQVLGKVYGDYDQLKIGQPTAQSNGSVRVDWSYQKEASNGSMVAYKGKSFIKQIDNKISASYYVIPAQQTTQLAAPFDRIIRSYQVSDVDIP
jgi:hypothetical protein